MVAQPADGTEPKRFTKIAPPHCITTETDNRTDYHPPISTYRKGSNFSLHSYFDNSIITWDTYRYRFIERSANRLKNTCKLSAKRCTHGANMLHTCCKLLPLHSIATSTYTRLLRHVWCRNVASALQNNCILIATYQCKRDAEPLYTSCKKSRYIDNISHQQFGERTAAT